MSRPPETGDHGKPLDELFSDLVDGRLPPEQQLALRQRLDRDPELRREFERFQRMLAVLHAERSLDLERGDPEPPADLTANILAALRGDHGSGRPTGGGRSLLPYLASLFSAAAAVLLFLLLLPHERPRGAADVLRVGDLSLLEGAAEVDKVAVDKVAAGNPPAEESRRQGLPDRERAATNPDSRFKEATPPERARDESRLEKSAKVQEEAKEDAGRPPEPAPANKAKSAEPLAKGEPVTGGGGGGRAVPPASAPQGTVTPVGKDFGEFEKQVAAVGDGKAGDDTGRRWAGDDPQKRPEAKSRAGEAGSKGDDRDQVGAPASRPGAPAPADQPRGLMAQQEPPPRESQLDLRTLGYLSGGTYQSPATGLTCLSVTVADVEAQATLERSFAALQPDVFSSFRALAADTAAAENDRTKAGFSIRNQEAESRAAGSGESARYLLRVRAPADRLQASLAQLQAAAIQLQSRVVSLDAGTSALVLSPDSQWRSFGWPRGADPAGERLAQTENVKKLEAEQDAGVDRFGAEHRGGGAGSQSTRSEIAKKEDADKDAEAERVGQAEEKKAAANETRKAEQPKAPPVPGNAARGGRVAGTGTRSGAGAPGASKGPPPGSPATPGPTTEGPTPDPTSKPSSRALATAAKDAPIDFYLLVIYPRTAPAENKAPPESKAGK